MLSLVTGGAGFLGSHLVDRLISQGDKVIIVDNLSTGSLRNLDRALRSSHATFVYLDIAQPVDLIRGPILEAARFKSINRIFHLASPANPETRSTRPWDIFAVNTIGTMALIDLALEHDAALVYASTSEIGEDPLMHRPTDSHNASVDPTEKLAHCDESKRFGEAAVSMAVAQRGLDARLVRLFDCYGPRMSLHDGRLIATLAEAAFASRPLPIQGTGTQTTSMTFVDDAIKLLLLMACVRQPDLSPVDVGSDEGRTVFEIAQAVANAVGVPFTYEHVPSARYHSRPYPDLTRARSVGYVPQVSLEAGLTRTITWLRDSAPSYA